MKTVILAGGKGTRLKEVIQDLPKPMARINGQTILEHQIGVAKRYGIEEIILLTGFMGNVIRDYFGDGSKWGVKIQYVQENSPLGTAGAIKQLESFLNEDFMVFYGDIIFDINLKKLMDFHEDSQSLATLVVHPNDHPFDSDLVEVDQQYRITSFLSKPHKENLIYRNLVNAGLYVLKPDIFKFIPAGKKCDFGSDIFPQVLKNKLKLSAYNTPEYIKDAGTPDRFRSIGSDLASKKVVRLNIENRRSAVFLDRDGTIIENMDTDISLDNFKLLQGVSEGIKQINSTEMLAIVVTNQPMVAKGFITMDELHAIHKKLETELGGNGAKLDGIYFCPHHPEKGFKGEIEALKVYCNCRKPRTGLIEKAVNDFNIDIENSYFIGDTSVDVETARNARIKSILINASLSIENELVKPDFCCRNFTDAVNIVMRNGDSI